MSGSYYSNNFTTSSPDQDILVSFVSQVGGENITLRKMTLISTTNISVSINGVAHSKLFQDVDGFYKLSLSADDVLVSSIKILENSSTVFLAGVF